MSPVHRGGPRLGSRGPDAEQRDAARTRRRLPAWKLATFGVATTLLFFGAFEGMLALFRVQPLVANEDPYVGFVSNLPLYVEETQPDGQRLMVTARNKLSIFNPQRFARQKPPDTYRIFCLGGSTTYGHPYNDTTSYPGWLREILNAADPSRHWEVLNAGGVSYASYREAVLMQELARYSPDLFVVYSGHNEFLERRTYSGILNANPGVTWLGSVAGRTRTYAVVRSAARALRGDRMQRARKRYQMTAEVDALLDATVGPAAYARDDTLRRQVEAHYRFNLARMARIARAAGSRIVYVTPASNLKDCSPFKSQHESGLPSAEGARCDTLLVRAAAAQKVGDLDAAGAALLEAVKIDPRFADSQYRLGRVLFAERRYDEARIAFERAREEDVCPLRNLETMRQIILDVARGENAPCVDFVKIVADSTERLYGHRLPGEELFLDHAHPTVEGNRILAVALAQQLLAEGIFEPQAGWETAAVEAARRDIQGRIDRRMQAVSLRNVAKLFNWAGKTEEAVRLARQALELDGGDLESRVVLGAQASAEGRSADAIAEYTRVLQADSLHFEARNNLAAELSKHGKYEEALVHYNVLLRHRPEQPALQSNVAYAYLQLGQYDRAVEHYAKVVEIRPMDATAQSTLAFALMSAGRHEEGAAHYRKAIEIEPANAEVHDGLGLVLMRQGKSDAARAELNEALRLQPNYAVARMFLGVLLQQQGKRNEAQAAFERAARDDPKLPDAHNYLGLLLAEEGKMAPAMAAFEAELRLNPAHVDAQNNRAHMLWSQGKPQQAIQQYRDALRRQPDEPETLANFAWLLATHPDGHVRDGAQAVKLALRADELTRHQHPLALNALAAAYAEASRFADAVRTAQKALSIAESTGQADLAHLLQARLELYKAGRPCREASG